ncbi:hypothetical protein SPONN_797 [uncultured Candidatus Thioglobus sp.]|nr:hypothetical protein SPONN_797 [uncultured Candidatus Thioglobus sp.]
MSELSFKFSDLFTADYRLITALLIILPLIIYAQVYDFSFVWDDNGTDEVRHLNNPFVLNPSSESFGQLFSESYFGMYIPVSYLFWGMLKWFSELFSLPLNSVLHLSNVVVHIINGLLVFTVLRQFVNNKWAVLIGVLFFLLHPIQVEAVAWVSEFRNLLAFGFSLSALIIYLKNQTNLSYGSLLLFVLAVLSKPSAVVLPLIIFAINYFHYGFKLKHNIIRTLPFGLIALIAAIIIINIQSHGIVDNQVATYTQRPVIWLNSIALYLKQLIYPANLNAVYGLPVPYMVHQWWFAIFPIIPLSLGVYFWIVRKKQPLLLFASSLFLIGFLPTSGFASFSFQLVSVVADRYLYFSMLGVALLIASIFSTDKIIKQGLIIAVLVGFSALSVFKQIPIWNNELKLWQYVVNHAQYDSYYAKRALGSAFHNEGWALAKRGKNQQALAILDNLIANQFNHKLYFIDNTFYLRGVIMMQQQKYQKALSDFSQSVAINAKNSDSREGKIAVFTALGQCFNAQTEIDLMHQQQFKTPAFLLIDFQKKCPNQ